VRYGRRLLFRVVRIGISEPVGVIAVRLVRLSPSNLACFQQAGQSAFPVRRVMNCARHFRQVVSWIEGGV
jgi:hypothetical protein